MISKRPGENPSLKFVHRNHAFNITALPDCSDFMLQLSDRHGRILLPLSIRIPAADVWRGGKLDRRPIDAGMAKICDAIKQLDDTRFQRLIDAPRAADKFEWSLPDLEAATKIDWSAPAATLVHEGHQFSIGTFVTHKRMVFLLRDADGPFNAPFSMPRDSMVCAAKNGTNPATVGVNTMIAQVRAWSAARMAAFIKDTPRLEARPSRE